MLLVVNFVLLFSSVAFIIADFIQPAIILGIGTIATSVMLWVVSEKPIGSLSIKKENAWYYFKRNSNLFCKSNILHTLPLLLSSIAIHFQAIKPEIISLYVKACTLNNMVGR